MTFWTQTVKKNLNINTPMLCVWGFLIAFAAQAAMAGPGAIELRATAAKVVVTTTEDGQEKTDFVEPELVVPGDKIAYTIAAKNVSEEDVERVVITDPIPNEMIFVPGSEESGDATVVFSVDGGKSFDREEALTVVGEDGLSRPAMSTDFTHIRWVFDSPLAPTAERSVRFVALVE